MFRFSPWVCVKNISYAAFVLGVVCLLDCCLVQHHHSQPHKLIITILNSSSISFLASYICSYSSMPTCSGYCCTDDVEFVLVFALAAPALLRLFILVSACIRCCWRVDVVAEVVFIYLCSVLHQQFFMLWLCVDCILGCCYDAISFSSSNHHNRLFFLPSGAPESFSFFAEKAEQPHHQLFLFSLASPFQVSAFSLQASLG